MIGDNREKMTNSIDAVTSIAGRKIPYRIIQSVRARRLRLSVTARGVTVTLPKGTRPAAAERFLQENAQWLLLQLEKMEKAKQSRKLLPEDVIFYHGVPTRIQVVQEAERLSRMRVDIAQNALVVRVPAGTRAAPRSLVEPWLKAQARIELAELLKQQAARMRVSPKKLTIRDQRTRWGSCSTNGTISLNWRLIMALPSVMEYVVIHELAHLQQPNHFSAFWAVVARYAPTYKESRQWMRKHAAQLRPDEQ